MVTHSRTECRPTACVINAIYKTLAQTRGAIEELKTMPSRETKVVVYLAAVLVYLAVSVRSR